MNHFFALVILLVLPVIFSPCVWLICKQLRKSEKQSSRKLGKILLFTLYPIAVIFPFVFFFILPRFCTIIPSELEFVLYSAFSWLFPVSSILFGEAFIAKKYDIVLLAIPVIIYLSLLFAIFSTRSVSSVDLGKEVAKYSFVEGSSISSINENTFTIQYDVVTSNYYLYISENGELDKFSLFDVKNLENYNDQITYKQIYLNKIITEKKTTIDVIFFAPTTAVFPETSYELVLIT